MEFESGKTEGSFNGGYLKVPTLRWWLLTLGRLRLFLGWGLMPSSVGQERAGSSRPRREG